MSVRKNRQRSRDVKVRAVVDEIVRDKLSKVVVRDGLARCRENLDLVAEDKDVACEVWSSRPDQTR